MGVFSPETDSKEDLILLDSSPELNIEIGTQIASETLRQITHLWRHSHKHRPHPPETDTYTKTLTDTSEEAKFLFQVDTYLVPHLGIKLTLYMHVCYVQRT